MVDGVGRGEVRGYDMDTIKSLDESVVSLLEILE